MLENEKCITINRKDSLKGDLIPLSKVIYSTVKNIEKNYNLKSDIIAVVPIHCPLRSHEDIIEGFTTLILNNAVKSSVLMKTSICILHTQNLE